MPTAEPVSPDFITVKNEDLLGTFFLIHSGPYTLKYLKTSVPK